MEVTHIGIDIDFDEPFRIFAWSDAQCGSPNFRHDATKRWCDLVLESKSKYRHTYCVPMGDLADYILYHDKKRFNPAEMDKTLTIEDLADLAHNELYIVEKHFGSIMPLTLVSVEGNHEQSMMKYHSNDVHRRFVERCKDPDGVRYMKGGKNLGYVGFLRAYLYMGGTTQTSVDFAFNHGVGGGGKLIGYPTNKVAEVFEYTRADYCLMAHIHKMVVQSIREQGLNNRGDYVCGQVKWIGSTGCFDTTSKAGNGRYFEKFGKQAVDIGGLMAEIRIIRPRLNGERHLIKDMRLTKIDLDHPEWKYRRVS